MFFKSDQTNVADARDAVKKQLLRSLIQQVVDDLSDASNEDIDADVAEILSEDTFRAGIDSLRTAVTEGVQRHLYTGLVSEVVADLGPTEDDIEGYVETALADADLTAVREEIRSQTMDRLATEIIPAIVKEESDAVAEYRASEEDIASYVETALSGADLSTVREEIRSQTMDRLSTEIIPAIVKEESDVVTAFQASEEDVQSLVDSALEGIDVPAVREQVQSLMEQRLIQEIIPSVVKEESAALDASDVSEHSQRIHDAVMSMQADEVIGRLRTMVTDALQLRMQTEMQEAVEDSRGTLNRVKEEFIQERMEQFLMSADWRAALEEAEAEITAGVVSAIEETVANDTVFAERIDEEVESRVKGNNALTERLEDAAKDRVVSMLSGLIVADLDTDASVKSDLFAAVTSHEDVMAALTEHVSERIHEHLASETLVRLHNAERAADAAFLHVDTEHRHITEAVDSLEKQLVKEVSGRAVARLADAQTIQNKAMAWIPEDHTIITSAVEQILQHVSSEVRKRAIKEASDTETVVGNVLPSFTAETEEVRAAVRETRNKLVERVVNLTLHDMEDAKQVAAEATKRVANEHERILDAVASAMALLTDRVAEQAIERLAASDEVAPEAASRVPVDNEVFQRAIKATMSLLIDDIVIEVGSRMRSSEKVSSDARKRMAETPAEVRQAAGVLENMLLQQVAEMTKERLYDVQHASEKASTFLRATKEIDAIEEAMRIKLFKGMAEHVVASIEDPEKTGAEAFWHIDQQHDHILDAMAELRNQLLFNIAKETMSSISDSEAAAAESRTLIPATSRQLTEAAAKLHDSLVAEVAREAVNLMRDTETVVEMAGAKMEDHQDVLNGMRRIVERYLMENLLASALSDIGSNVTGMDEPAERVFFRNAVREIQSNRDEMAVTAGPKQGDSDDRIDDHEDVTTSALDADPVEMEAAPMDGPDDSDEASVSSQDAAPVQEEFTPEHGADNAWSSLDELSAKQSAEPATRNWRVNEFRPEDRDAVPGAVANGKRTRMPSFTKKEATKSALYLFGVVRTEDAQAEDFEGIEGISEGAAVRLLSCGNLTALVSATTDPQLQPDVITESMKDAGWLKAHVRRHADVLAEAQTIQTVIPLRFGCVMPNPSEIKKFVDAREDVLSDALTRLHNRSEFSVRVRFEDDGVADDDLKGVPSGVADFLRKAAADVEHAPSPDGIADRIHAHLSRFAGEAMRNAMQDAGLILNATYLITMASEDEFRTEVRKLSSEFHALGIRIEVSGPWPPYHFVDIDFGSDAAEVTA